VKANVTRKTIDIMGCPSFLDSYFTGLVLLNSITNRGFVGDTYISLELYAIDENNLRFLIANNS
jgi:hypothetical protein